MMVLLFMIIKNEHMEDNLTFQQRLGIQIREARKFKGLTQKQLSDKIKMNKSEISKLENGKISVTMRTILRIMEGLDCTFDVKIISNKPIEPKPLNPDFGIIVKGGAIADGLFVIKLDNHIFLINDKFNKLRSVGNQQHFKQIIDNKTITNVMVTGEALQKLLDLIDSFKYYKYMLINDTEISMYEMTRGILNSYLSFNILPKPTKVISNVYNVYKHKSDTKTSDTKLRTPEEQDMLFNN